MTRVLTTAAAVLMASVLATAPASSALARDRSHDAGAGVDSPTKEFQDRVAERQRRGE